MKRKKLLQDLYFRGYTFLQKLEAIYCSRTDKIDYRYNGRGIFPNSNSIY